MKKIFTLCFLMALVCVKGLGQVIVGTGTSNTNLAPINRNYNYSASEQIYLASEINASGSISSLAFYKASGSTTVTITPITIYLKITSATTVGTTASTTGYTQVYSGSFPNATASGWQTVTTTPFAYTTSSGNLSVLVIKGNQAFTNSYPSYNYTTAGSNTASYYYSDVTAWSSSVTMTRTTARPNISLGGLTAAPVTCTNTYMYPFSAFAAPAAGVTYQITTVQQQGDYNTMTGATAGTSFTSTASLSNTFITVRSGASNGPVVASGLTPLTWTAPTATTYYIHYNAGSSCGTSSTSMTTSIKNNTVVAAPANNECSGAITITPATTCSSTAGTTVGATQSLAATSGCPSSSANDVWYKFTADGVSSYTINATTNSIADLVLAVYSGTCASLTYITCSDGPSTGTETINVGVLAAGTYYYRIFGFDGASGTFTSCVTYVGAPSCATLSTPVNGAANVSREPLILTWNATTNATSYDVYAGTSVATAVNIGNTTNTSIEVYNALGSTTYYWYIVPKNAYGSATGCSSNARSFTTAAGPANDECSGATAVTLNAAATSTTNVNAGETILPSSCSGATSTYSYDVWYKFTANSSSQTITVASSSIDVVVEGYTGSCGALTSLGCTDANGTGSSETLSLTGLTPCATYYFRVYGYDGNTGAFTVQVAGTSSLTAPSTASSNVSSYCSNAIPSTITLTANGGGASGTLTWYSGSCGGTLLGTGNSLVIAAPTTTITYYARYECGTNITTCASTTVTVNSLPSAPTVTITQPTCATATATITVTAPTGSGFTYSLDNGTYVSATSFSGVATGNHTIYVKNSSGCIASSSVTVNAQPAAPAAPAVSVTQPTCATATATITVTAPTGSGFTYSLDNGIYQASTTFSNVATGSHTVTVSNGSCTSTATSATVNAQPATPTATISYSGSPFCATGTASVTQTGQTGGNYAASNNGLSINSSTGAINLTSSTPGTYIVTYSFTNSSCPSSTTTSVTVNASPLVYNFSSSSTTSCADNPTAQLTLENSETGVNYQLYRNNVAVGSPISGTTGSALDFGYVTVSGTYKVIGTEGNCTTTMSGMPAVTVTTISVYNVTGSGTTCGTGTITLSGSQTNVIYHLTGASTQNKNGTGSALIFTVTTSGTYSINATNGGCYEDMNGTPAVTVNPLPTQYTVTGGGISCSGTPVAIGLNGSQTGVNYQLYRGSTITVGTAVAGTGSAISFASQSTVGTYTVIATHATTGCQQTMSSSAVITAGTSPTASFDQSTYTSCAPIAAGVVFKGSANATISYTISTNSGSPVAQTPVTIDASGNNQVINSSTAAGTYTYTITNATVSGNSCPGVITTGTTTVTINQPPVVAAITGPDFIALSKTGTYSSTTAGGAWAITSDPGNTGSTITSQSSNPASATVTAGATNVGTITLSYTVVGIGGCSTTVTKAVQIFNNTIARYRSYQDGKASEAATWEFYNDNGNWIYPSPTIPDNSSNIEIRHNVRMEIVDYDGTAQASVSITNHTENSVTVDGTLTIFPGRFFQSQGSVNFGGKRVLLKSDATGTGAIGIMATPIANASNVQVERFTDGKPSVNATSSRRAWRLITSPVTGQNIHEAWQENAVSNRNPNPGYGTLITGYNMPDSATAAAQGYDFTGAGFNSSIRQYSPASDAWVSIPNTYTSLQNQPAYMLYVRGDRTVGIGTNATSTPATLRSTGTLQQGAMSSVSFQAGAPYVLVGNPYASAIDFGHLIGHNTAIKDQFTTWNSTIGTYGAYVVVTHTGSGSNEGGYEATPAAITGLPAQNDNNYRFIPNGSGFFVTPATSTTSGSVSFTEEDKAPGKVPPVNPFRIVDATHVRELLVNLNLKDSDTSATLADGFRVRFSADYEGNEQDNSSLKAINFNENLGLVRAGDSLIIEARGDVRKTDTLYMKLWNTTKRSYQFQVKADNFRDAPGVRAWLEDSYLGSKQELSLTGSVTTINFSVSSDSGSWNPDRFRIVFDNSSALPVTITRVTAQPKNGGAEVSWTVAGEVNIKGYTVEKSTDGGRTYAGVAGTQQAAHNNPQAALTSYSGYDAAPQAGDNLYRIRIEGRDGSVSYSEIVKVTIGLNGTGIQITLYPNPVREGKANLLLTNLAAGTYLAGVYTGSGQTVYQRKVSITQGGTTQTEVLLLGNRLAQGAYQIRVADHTGKILFTDKLVVAR